MNRFRNNIFFKMYRVATNFGPEWVIFWNDWERREFDWLTRLWERKRRRSLRKREKRALCLGKKEEERVFVMFVSFLCVIWEGECMCNNHMSWFLFLFGRTNDNCHLPQVVFHLPQIVFYLHQFLSGFV